MHGKRLKVGAAALVAVASGLLATPPASADYGNSAWRQIELSANVSGHDGGGVWLWLELSSDGSVDYAGSDCGHGLGAASDRGEANWSWQGDNLVIWPVVLNGLGGFPATVTVPGALGHYRGTVGSFISLPPFIPASAGTSQLQVAP